MQRRLPLIVLGVVVALSGAGAGVAMLRRSSSRSTAPRPATTAVARRVVRDVPPPERAVLPASLDALRARLVDRWRLRPDARFALALRHLAALVAPDAPAPELRFAGGRWAALVGGAPAATLPAEVTFDAMLTAATDYARSQQLPQRLHLDASGVVGSVDVATLRDPWGAARAADARWTAGARGASDVAAVGRALAWTAALTPDPLGVGDAVAGRALAALALARAAGATDAASEAVLCRAMTYTAEAAYQAGGLSDDPAVGAWLRGDVPGLESLAREGDRTARWLRDVARSRDEAPSDVAAARRAAPEMLARVLTALEREEAAMSAPGATAFARFAALEVAGGSGGAWTDAGVTQAQRRARWGTGLARVLAATQAVAATPAQAQEVLAALGAADDPMTTEWLRWAREHVVTSGGAAARGALGQEVGGLRSLGVPARVRSLQSLVREGQDGTPGVIAVLASLAGQMDQRPAHRLALGELMLDVARDVPRAQSLLDEGTEQGAGVDAAASVRGAALRGDRAALLALARGEAVAMEGRVAALRALGRSAGTDAGAQDAAWEAIVDRDAGLRVQWALALVDRRELARARAMLEPLAARRGDAAAQVAAVAGLADVMLRLRDAPGAWRLLEPWAAAEWTAPLALGARALVEMERLEEAERLARRAWDRDEGPGAAALLAEVRWRRNDLAGASEALSSRAAAMSDRAWVESVGGSFDAVFAGRSASEGQRAIDALGGAIDVMRRSSLLGAMVRTGHGAVAAEIHAHLEGDGATGLALLADRYRLRAAGEGELAAAEWLQGQVPVGQRGDFAEVAFGRGLDELLWSVVETPAGGASGDRVWLLRAASSLRRGADDPHRAELLDHLRASESGTWAHVLARHLMDLAPMEAVRAQADSEEQQWQTAFYLGMKARAAGEAAAASDWMHGALDPGENASAETRWATAALREWATAGRTAGAGAVAGTTAGDAGAE